MSGVGEMARQLLSWRPQRLARSALLVLSGLGARVLLQGVLVVVLARTLGATGYGHFVSWLAVTAGFAPLAGMGALTLVVRDVARDASSARGSFGSALRRLAVSFAPLSVAVVVIGAVVLPDSSSLAGLAMVAVADLLLAPVVDLVGRLNQALDRTGRMAALAAGLVAMRVSSAGVMLAAVGKPTSADWAFWYLVATALAAALALALAVREFGAPMGKVKESRFWEGGVFAIGTSAGRAHAELDKALLARLATPASAGEYSAAGRLVDVVMLPVLALLEAAVPRFFRAGSAGASAMVSLATRILPVPAVYALIGAPLLWAVADILPWLLGEDFAASAEIVRYLCALPAFMLLRHVALLMWLTSTRPQIATGLQVTGAVVNVTANLVLIPRLGWQGAVVSVYASEAIMSVAGWAGWLVAGVDRRIGPFLGAGARGAADGERRDRVVAGG